MGGSLKEFWYEEDGIGTVEIVLIIIVLIGLALLFKNTITSFLETILSKIKGTENNFKIDPKKTVK